MKHKFQVDTNKCIKCGLCIQDCLTGAIQKADNGTPEMKNPLNCIKCEHCLAICPKEAISILDKNPENSFKINEKNPDEILNLIQSRRSVRKYKSQNVQKETIQKLKDMLNYVPTGCNNHSLHFSFIEDIEVMDDFRNKVNSKVLSILNNKNLKGLVNKFSNFKNDFMEGKDVIFRGAPHLVVACAPINSPCPNQDGIIALSYFELYANSLGLGTLWCGFAQYVLKLFPDFCEYLQIPNGYKPIYVMLFGYSDIKYQRTIQPEKYSFITVEKNEAKGGLISNIKRVFWNFIR